MLQAAPNTMAFLDRFIVDVSSKNVSAHLH